MPRMQQNETSTWREGSDDRRSADRREVVLLVGLLEQDGGSLFCIIKNIAASGVQVMPYGTIFKGTVLCLRLSDEDPIRGTVVWCRDGTAGVQFDQPLSPEALMRIGKKMVTHRRRTSARVATALKARLRIGDETHSATICELSVTGARVRTVHPVPAVETMIVEVAGLPGLHAQLRWKDGPECGVTFQVPLPKQLIGDLLSTAHPTQTQ